MIIPFILNHRHIEIDSEPHRRLSNLLQETLGVKSLKTNCLNGSCGACLVIWQGKLTSSCLVMASAVKNTEVTTIEGFEETKELQAIVKAFRFHHVHLCPYCTPSRSLAIIALLRKHPSPTNEQIENTLTIVNCNCSGYSSLKKAISYAADLLRTYG